MKYSEVYLTWNDSRRSKSLCAALSLTRVVHVAERRGALRHLLGVVITGLFILRRRPHLVWYQYSQALGVLLALYRQLMPADRVRLVADLHTKALRREAPGPIAGAFQTLKRYALRSCACTLVANRQDGAYARARFGVEPLVLSDPLPDAPTQASSGPAGPVVFICSFAVDEPVELMLEVSRRMSPRLSVVITGDARRLDSAIREELTRSAQLSGFLPEADYWALLRSARCIVVLTSEVACLPCGAYEAIAVGHSPIVVDDAETRHVFGSAVRYTALTVDGVSAAIELAAAEPPAAPHAEAFRDRWNQRWRVVRNELAARLSLPRDTSHAPDGQYAGS